MRIILLAIVAIFSTSALAANKISVFVDGMTCPSCGASVEKHLKAIPQVDSVDIILSSGSVIVTLKNGGTLSNADVAKAISEAGYKVKPPSAQPQINQH